MDKRAIRGQHVAHGQGGCLTHVSGVLLESEAKDSNLFIRHCVEKCMDNANSEAFLPVLVHVYNLLPIGSNLVKPELLANINQVQDVLLEARATEADRGVQ